MFPYHRQRSRHPAAADAREAPRVAVRLGGRLHLAGARVVVARTVQHRCAVPDRLLRGPR